MLNTMQNQRTVGERLIPVSQYSDYHQYKGPTYNNSYNQFIKQRFLLNHILFTSQKIEFRFF